MRKCKETEHLIKKYKCPTCNEEDTILFCCECMRKIHQDKMDKFIKKIPQLMELAKPKDNLICLNEYVKDVIQLINEEAGKELTEKNIKLKGRSEDTIVYDEAFKLTGEKGE